MKRCTSFGKARFVVKSSMHSRLAGGVATYAAILALTMAFLCSLPAGSVAGNSNSIDPMLRADVMEGLSSTSLTFTQNLGQWPDSILFRAGGGGATMWITSTGVYYQFTRVIERADAGRDDDLIATRHGTGSDMPDSAETMLIKAAFVGGNPNPEVVAEGLMDYKCNYFLGDDPAKWRTDVPNFSSLTLKDIYPGIDVRFSQNTNGRFSYEYDIAAGADADQVQLEYKGPAEVSRDATGRMTAATKWGEISGLLADPGSRLSGGVTVPAGSRAVDLEYGTYLGGTYRDAIRDIAVDEDGRAVVTGSTYSYNFPTEDAIDTTKDGAYSFPDVFVTKFTADGDSLVFSTYLGGEDVDEGFGIALDGYIYLTGHTRGDFPIKSYDHAHYPVYDASFNGGQYGYDAFVTMLSSGGSGIKYSTYLGGENNDYGVDIAVSSENQAYVTGRTNSYEFPTVSAFDDSLAGDWGNTYDAFVTRLSRYGHCLEYSTYLGGESDEEGNGIAVDQTGSAYVTGGTFSSDFPIDTPFDSTKGGTDVFVTKLSPNGHSLVYSTYLGGSDQDCGYGIAVDSVGSAYVTGTTLSSDYPVQGAYDGSYNGAGVGWSYGDCFVTKLSPVGNSLVYSTYLGGTDDDAGFDIAVGLTGVAYVVGRTWSDDYPTYTSLDGSLSGVTDAFVAMLNPSGYYLTYSTYLGGDSSDVGLGVAVDNSGGVYVAGETNSPNFPTTNPFDPSLNGDADAFVIKLIPDCCICPTRGNLDNSTDCLITMGDLTVMTDHLYGSLAPLTCPVAGNLDLSPDGLVTAGDLTVLIDHLFISLAPLPECPQ